jgi:hypothetical protein
VAKVPETIAGFYEQKIEVHKQFIAIASAFVSGPKPGVDYGAMTADAPKLTAMLEYLDRAQFSGDALSFCNANC